MFIPLPFHLLIVGLIPVWRENQTSTTNQQIETNGNWNGLLVALVISFILASEMAAESIAGLNQFNEFHCGNEMN